MNYTYFVGIGFDPVNIQKRKLTAFIKNPCKQASTRK